MILRMLMFAVAIGCSLDPTLFAGTTRGDRLVSEAGGAAGIPGAAGPSGAPGVAGAAGSQGIQGVPGIPGAPGILDFSDFYALMPPDNAATVAPGTAVQFPQNGSTNGVIVRTGPSTFLLPTIGTYLVQFQVSVTEPAQLMLRLNGAPIPNSVVGRATGTTQLVGTSLVTTTAPGSILEVINPTPNSTALIITPNAGGTQPVSAHLVIIRIQ